MPSLRTVEGGSPPSGGGDDLQRGLDLAYRRVARADQTVAQVRRHLSDHDVERGTVDEVVAVLTEQGYLDDGRYARRFVEDRRNLDGWGSQRIQQRLVAAGIDPEVAVAATSRPADEELEAAIGLLRRRLGVSPCDRRERDRALGLLVRRGYDFELACDAVRAHQREARPAR